MRKLAVALLSVALLTAPPAAEPQPAKKVYRIGYLGPATMALLTGHPLAKRFLRGLEAHGYVEGRDYVMEWRAAEYQLERLPALAADLVRRQVDVIAVTICGPPLDAARRATTTIPIVVIACQDDIVATGVVASLARPGGNVTGQSKPGPELSAKRLELLKNAMPHVSRVAVVWNPLYADFSWDWQATRAAAQMMGILLQSVEFRSSDELDAAIAKATQARADAFMTFSDNLTVIHAKHVADLAVRHRLPGIFAYREGPDAGGLMSYGPSLADMWGHAATFVAKILKGLSPPICPSSSRRSSS